MVIYKEISQLEKNNNTVLTLGTFDGVHLGHKKIMETLHLKSKTRGSRNLVITFEPHPRTVLYKNSKRIELLTSFKEKVAFFEELKVDNLLVLNFTESFSQIPSDVFFKEFVIDKIGLSEIIVGHDHKFGKARGGDETLLKELGAMYNFDVTPVTGITLDDITVSSTKIRNLLYEGDVTSANRMLGRPFSFQAKVVEGDKRGRLLGFPTANVVDVDANKLTPAIGVYSVEVFINSNKYPGVMNIGRRPTFDDTGNQVVKEVHIIDFEGTIYGEEITVNVIDRIREEKRFASKDELIKQINIDRSKSLEILSGFKDLTSSSIFENRNFN